MKILWSSQARRDLQAIHNFISRDSELYARQMVIRLIERTEYISQMPTMGHRVHEYPELPLRETHEGTYRIIYDFDDVALRVVTIVHMKQILRRRRLS